jgi:hypothetical protein
VRTYAAYHLTNGASPIFNEVDSTNPQLTEAHYYYDRAESFFKFDDIFATTDLTARAIDLIRGTGDNYTNYASGNSPPYGVAVYVQFHEGLAEDYRRNGSTASRDVVGRMADYLTADYYRLSFGDTTSAITWTAARWRIACVPFASPTRSTRHRLARRPAQRWIRPPGRGSPSTADTSGWTG